MTTETISRRRDTFLISSDRTLLSLPAIAAAFASPALYWCKPLPAPQLRLCLDNSFCLGLYHDLPASPTPPSALATPPAPAPASAPAPEQIGLVRFITDYTTFAYLTDVYVVPEYQGKGLGKWLVQVADEVLGGMGDLRRALLMAGEEQGRAFYEGELGFKVLEQGRGGLWVLSRTGGGATERMV